MFELILECLWHLHWFDLWLDITYHKNCVDILLKLIVEDILSSHDVVVSSDDQVDDKTMSGPIPREVCFAPGVGAKDMRLGNHHF